MLPSGQEGKLNSGNWICAGHPTPESWAEACAPAPNTTEPWVLHVNLSFSFQVAESPPLATPSLGVPGILTPDCAPGTRVKLREFYSPSSSGVRGRTSSETLNRFRRATNFCLMLGCCGDKATVVLSQWPPVDGDHFRQSHRGPTLVKNQGHTSTPVTPHGHLPLIPFSRTSEPQC